VLRVGGVAAGLEAIVMSGGGAVLAVSCWVEEERRGAAAAAEPLIFARGAAAAFTLGAIGPLLKLPVAAGLVEIVMPAWEEGWPADPLSTGIALALGGVEPLLEVTAASSSVPVSAVVVIGSP
jgi:hypothetical protein